MDAGRDCDRPPRSGSPRSSGPGRRSADTGDSGGDSDAARLWELWNFRTLFPDAQPVDLAQVKQRRRAILAREREALVRLWSGERGLLSPGRSFFAAHPALRSGVTVSVHTGPYQLLAEPWLATGCDVVILLNRTARARFARGTEAMRQRLRLPGRVTWAAVGEPGFMRQLLKAVRDDQPVLVYLDGNTGQAGMAGTRERGLRYQLPGREIRVRTGLARLVCRTGCPVHPVALHWDADGGLVWRKAPTRRWGAGDDPHAVTRELFDWAFGRILARPEQWDYWDMLKQSSACFAATGFDDPAVPAGLRRDFQQAFATCHARSPATVRLILDKEIAVWPGGVLADLSEDRFYRAGGLRDEDLDILRDRTPTLAELDAHHGPAWTGFHGLRLCLLGMARLGGAGVGAA